MFGGGGGRGSERRVPNEVVYAGEVFVSRLSSLDSMLNLNFLFSRPFCWSMSNA